MSEDLRQLRSVLRQAIQACGLSARQVERAVGLGHGNLERILDGRNELRVRHILGFARLLQVPPQDFLELGCPQPEAATRYRLKDWIMPRQFGPPNAGKSPDGPPDDLAKLVREAVQEALAAGAMPGGMDLKETVRAVLREELDGKARKAGR